ncbi:hypothetical protein BaRGS_00005523 [Batillaria attramentaria]|uniref:Uncharacterized protein n=1 Tax=Batillaria attramentaria TaxID=370345 RepID=A0ABD0LV54_9CAEN
MRMRPCQLTRELRHWRMELGPLVPQTAGQLWFFPCEVGIYGCLAVCLARGRARGSCFWCWSWFEAGDVCGKVSEAEPRRYDL